MTQEQAKKLTFPCKVRVTKAGNPSYWYSGAIGGIFKVTQLLDDENHLIVNYGAISIEISDCELYEEPKEVNPQPDEQPDKVKLSPDEIYQAWKDGKVVKWVGYTITDMYKFSGGKIVFEDTSNSISTGVCGLDNAKYFTIEEPIEAMFTPVYFIADNSYCEEDYKTIEDAKENCTKSPTCILEHHKINGKWVFVKAHKID